MEQKHDEQYYMIYSWMPKLGLRGTALAVYAVIYGYTANGRTWHGSCGTLADRVGSTRENVSRTLASLTERGLIRTCGVHTGATAVYPEYVAQRPEAGCDKTSQGCDKISQGVCRNVTGGVMKRHIIIKDNNIDDNQGTDTNTPSSGGLTERASERRKEEAELFEKEFEALWAQYPRRQGRSDARRAYIRARRSGVAEETVRQGLEAYRRSIEAQGTEPRFVKQGGNWFLHRCWEDEPTAETARSPRDRGFVQRPKNRALNYRQRQYTREDLIAMGVSLGEEAYCEQ